MAKKDDDELDWEKLKAGRLDEGESEARLLSGRGSRTPPMVLRRMVFRVPRKVALTRDAPRLSFRTGPGAELARRTTAAPFHMAHSFVSRARTRSTPRSVANGTRVAVFPLICPLQSGPKVNLDWTLKETEHGQEARA